MGVQFCMQPRGAVAKIEQESGPVFKGADPQVPSAMARFSRLGDSQTHARQTRPNRWP